jgi:hypothetical protein
MIFQSTSHNVKPTTNPTKVPRNAPLKTEIPYIDQLYVIEKKKTLSHR